jgi:hypothetical protein
MATASEPFFIVVCFLRKYYKTDLQEEEKSLEEKPPWVNKTAF